MVELRIVELLTRSWAAARDTHGHAIRCDAPRRRPSTPNGLHDRAFPRPRCGATVGRVGKTARPNPRELNMRKLMIIAGLPLATTAIGVLGTSSATSAAAHVQSSSGSSAHQSSFVAGEDGGDDDETMRRSSGRGGSGGGGGGSL